MGEEEEREKGKKREEDTIGDNTELKIRWKMKALKSSAKLLTNLPVNGQGETL